MARGGIDPFALLNRSSGNVPAEPTEAIPQILQRRPSRAKRNREWERKNKPICYRGIPTALHTRIKTIATELAIPTGDLARAFLEAGLAAYEAGEMKFEVKIVGKRRLYND